MVITKRGSSRTRSSRSPHKPFGALEQGLASGEVSGWIAGVTSEGCYPEVEFIIGNEPIGRCEANLPTTQRLLADELPIRRFRFTIPEQYRVRRFPLKLVARLADDEYELTGSPLLLPPTPQIVGAVEYLGSPAIEGWALDILHTERPIVITAVRQGVIVAIGSTQSGLQPVRQQGVSGDFRFRVPILAATAQELAGVQLMVANTDQQLGWSNGIASNLGWSDGSLKSFNFLLD